MESGSHPLRFNRLKRIVAQEVEVYWRKLCCTNGLPEPLPSSP